MFFYRLFPEVKKYALKILLLLIQKSRTKQCVDRKVWAVSNTLGIGVWGSVLTPEKFGFSFSFKRKNSILNHLYLYCKYKHIFFLKTGNLVLNWVSLSFSDNCPMPERLSSQSNPPNVLVN